jgi:hypothetical protein
MEGSRRGCTGTAVNLLSGKCKAKQMARETPYGATRMEVPNSSGGAPAANKGGVYDPMIHGPTRIDVVFRMFSFFRDETID